MSIYVYKNNQQAGPFEETAVLEWLKNSQLSGEDFGCQTGAKEWQKLKILFANPVQSSAVSTVVSMPTDGVSNQPVSYWARQNLQIPVKVKGLFNSLIVIGLCYAFSALFFIVLPCLVLISTIYRLITEGWNESVKEGLIISTVFVVGFGGISLFIVLTRRVIATVLNSEGVKTLGKKTYLWENLYFLNYKTIMFKGSKQTSIEMVFVNGKAIIPPHTSNKSEILQLFETMPVQRRDNGRIWQ